MLRKNLYDLCNFIYFPYSAMNSPPDLSYFVDTNLFYQLQSKINFKLQWNKKNKLIINDFKLSFKYKIIEQTSDLLKIKFSIKSSFMLDPIHNNIESAIIDDYILIAGYSANENIKIYNLISKEENPYMYYSLYKNGLDFIADFIPLKLNNPWDYNIKLITSLYDKLQSLSYHFSNRKSKDRSRFDIEAACNYAETFALSSNPDYISYDKIGGDCTNFASQILHAGGLNTSSTWKPYSNAWLRVEELYSYLIYNKLAYKIDNNNFSRGTLIQFSMPKIGRFFHTGFITYRLLNGELLYCCHSYNKLNYPLSQIYPVLYPKIRGLNIY
ncbi:MAG: amidase domain-containing protein [Clostridium sp.]